MMSDANGGNEQQQQPVGSISVLEFEAKVLELEEIVIVVRAPSGARVGDYAYERKSSDAARVGEWLETRIKPLVGGHEVAIVSGAYSSVHGRLSLAGLRESYVL